MATRADIVRVARTWLGTDYFHACREKGAFCDCIGLIIGVARELDLGDYRRKDYDYIPDPTHMGNEMRKHLDVIEPRDAGIGDIYWFAFQKIPRHVGIICDYPLGGHGIIHSYKQAKGVVEHRLDRKWRSRVCGAFRYRGLEDE